MVPDTRELAVAWCSRNLPPGSRVLLTSGGPALPQDLFTVWPRLRAPLPGMRLDPRTGRVWSQETADERRLVGHADYVIVSSYWLRRFEYGGPVGAPGYYADLDALWGPPVATFAAAAGPYAFHNPKLRVYRRPPHRQR
jgi:hypothetical protein